MVDAARAAWPAVRLPAEDFVAHLGEKLAEDANPARAFDEVLGADLYLACACAHAEPAAIEAFEKHFFSRVAMRLAGSVPERKADDIVQTLRVRLLAGDTNPRPRIAEYGGRAPLAVWLRVVAARFAIDVARARTLPDGSQPVETLRAQQPDPEIAYLKSHHREDLEAAFRDTLAGLSPKTANMLRLSYIDGVPTLSIAKLYRVSERTAQRWIADARDRVLQETQRRLGERLRLSASEVGSLIGLVQSQIDVSICKFLREDDK